MYRRVKTLRVRFALWVAGLLLAAMMVFGSFVYVSMAHSLAGAIDDSLELGIAQALAAVHVKDGVVSFQDSIPQPRDLRERGLTIRVLDQRGQVQQAVGPYGHLPMDASSLSAALRGESTFVTQRDATSHESIRVRTAPIVVGDRVLGIVQVEQSLDEVEDMLQRLVGALLLGVPLLVVLVALGGYVLAAHTLQPIDAITRAARRITAEALHDRLNLPPTDDEVGRLAATFDAMLDRLDDSFQRERRFTADASHELRTPLAAMQMILGVIRAQKRTPDDYEQALDDLATEATRLRGLVEDLLRLARSDTHRALSRTPIDLSLLLDDVVETMRPLIVGKGLTLTCAITPMLLLRGDHDDLIRLFMNVLDNALKYTVQGGIAICAGRTADGLEVRIQDTGCGIAAEHVPYVFERFFRVDRARGVGGSGLGLAIAQEIACAHGGIISITSVVGTGSLFVVRLPIGFDAARGF